MGAWACLAGKPVFPAAASDECRVLISLPFSVFRGAGGCARSPRPPPAPPLPRSPVLLFSSVLLNTCSLPTLLTRGCCWAGFVSDPGKCWAVCRASQNSLRLPAKDREPDRVRPPWTRRA